MLEFECKERVLEFIELVAIHSGESMAESLHKMLAELQIEHKLLTITADYASDNETLLAGCTSPSERNTVLEISTQRAKRAYASKASMAIYALGHTCSI